VLAKQTNVATRIEWLDFLKVIVSLPNEPVEKLCFAAASQP
jgi:hypothetical protein